MSDNNNSSTPGEAFLTPKSFYFFIENTDAHTFGSGGLPGDPGAQYSGPDDRYHVEVALYRLNEDGDAIDRVGNGQVHPYILRSWVESSNFGLVPGYGKTDFSKHPIYPLKHIREDMGYYSQVGIPTFALPAMVVVNTPELESDREYIAYARVFDGFQWSLWKRVPQTRMDVVAVDKDGKPKLVAVDKDGKPKLNGPLDSLRDLPISKPCPTIQMTVESEPAIERAEAIGAQIKLAGTVRDSVPIRALYVNGTKVDIEDQDQQYDKKEQQYVINEAKLKAKLKPIELDEGSKRIEIIAENAAGGRSHAVKFYHADYEEGRYGDAKGRVRSYKLAGGPSFVQEGPAEEPKRFYLVHHAIPYQLPPEPSEETIAKALCVEGTALTADDAPKNCRIADVLIGNNAKPHSLVMRRLAVEKRQAPYLGLDVTPDDIKDDIEEPTEKKGKKKQKVKLLTAIRVKVVGTNDIQLDEELTPVKAPKEDSWVWCSEPLMLVQGGVRTRNTLPARLGDLMKPYVYVQTGQSSSGGSLTHNRGTDDYHLFGPLMVAAGTQPISPQSYRPLPALKNGDVIRVKAFTAKAYPRVTVNVKTKHVHKDYEEWTAAGLDPCIGDPEEDFKTWVGLVEEDLKDPEARSFRAVITNLRDDLTPDAIQRHDPEAPTTTRLALRAHRALGAGAPPERVYGQSPEPLYAPPRAPGRVRYVLLSIPKDEDLGKEITWQARLVTQEYLPNETVKDRAKKKYELQHQILPYGHLSIKLEEKPKGGSFSSKGLEAATCSYRTLEITKRWYMDNKPSVQPAFAGTSPRVGAVGTHRVAGLLDNPRDGSVYVHNGELFQASEDLHIKGKVMDLTFRRTYLSHSLFTSSLGRNWDWMGNMRVVEMLNGDVHLMNGESQIETYESKKKSGANQWGWLGRVASLMIPEVRTIKNMRAGKFNYASLYDQSQYVSPKGVYRSLIKGKRVDLKDKLPAGGAETARFYLVDKHGAIWTFIEDQRFRTGAGRTDDLTDADKATEHEPIPGVRAQYLLVCIHDRRQANYIKLQRDASGLVQAVIDDHGRVTRVHHKAALGLPASHDKLVAVVKGFLGRTYTCGRYNDAKTQYRPRSHALGYAKDCHSNYSRYQYANVGGDAPLHRIAQVDVTTASGAPKDGPLLEVLEWYGARAMTVVEAGKYLYELHPDGSGVNYMESSPGYDSRGNKSRNYNVHTYELRQSAGRSFCEVSSHTVHNVHSRGALGGHVKDVKTTFKYNDEGEMTKSVAGQQPRTFEYSVKGSTRGNLIKSVATGGQSEQTFYTDYDLAFNLPQQTSELGYADRSQAKSKWTTRRYDKSGNLKWIVRGKVGAVAAWMAHRMVSWTYRSDGLPETMTNQRGAVTRYDYYAEYGKKQGSAPNTTSNTKNDSERDHLPGDGWDCVDMLAIEQTQIDGGAPSKPNIEIHISNWSKISGYNRPSSTGWGAGWESLEAKDLKSKKVYVTAHSPTAIGLPDHTVDSNHVKHSYLYTKAGQPRIIDWDERHEYHGAYLTRTKLERVPGGAHWTSYVNDALGNRVQESPYFHKRHGVKAEYDMMGNPVRTLDEKSKLETIFVYDPRGLLLRRITRDTKSGTSTDDYAYDEYGNMVLHRDPCGWCEAWRYNDGSQLVLSMNKRGLLQKITPGPGGLVRQEQQYDPPTIESARNRLASSTFGNSILNVAAKMAIYALAKRVANRKAAAPVGGKLLSGVTYHRDEQHRVDKEVRVWGAVGSKANKTVTIHRKWTKDDLVKRTWTEGGEDNPPATVREYDRLGRVLKQHQLPGKTASSATASPAAASAEQLKTTLTYGEHGSVRTEGGGAKTTRGPIDEYTTAAYDNVTERTLEETYARHGLADTRRTPFSEEEFKGYDDSLRLTKKVMNTWGQGLSKDDGVEVTHTWEYDDYGAIKEEKVLGDGNAALVRSYENACMFGPRTMKVGGKIVESRVKYDNNGNKTHWTDANGTSFAASYDGYGQMMSLSARQGRWSLMHARSVCLDGLGRPVRMWDKQWRHFTSATTPANAETIRLETVWSNSPEVVNTFKYDTLGRLLSETQQIAGHPERTTSYELSAGGVQTKTTYPATGRKCITNLAGRNVADTGLTVTRTLDGMHMPKSVAYCEPGKEAAETLASHIVYDSVDGRPIEIDVAQLKQLPGYIRKGIEGRIREQGAKKLGHEELESRHETSLRYTATHGSEGPRWHRKEFVREYRRRWPYDTDLRRYTDHDRTVGRNRNSAHLDSDMTQSVRTEHLVQSNSEWRKHGRHVTTHTVEGPQSLNTQGLDWEHGKEAKMSVRGDQLNGLSSSKKTTQTQREVDADDKTLGDNDKLDSRLTNSYTLASANQRRLGLSVSQRNASSSPAGVFTASPGAVRLPAYPNGLTYAEPAAKPSTWTPANGPFIDRNVFGQPVAVKDSAGNTVRMTYDGAGRPVLRDTPARIQVQRDRDVDVVIDVSPRATGPKSSTPGDCVERRRVKTLREATHIISDTDGRRSDVYGANVLVRIHPGADRTFGGPASTSSPQLLTIDRDYEDQYKHVTFVETAQDPAAPAEGYVYAHNATFRGFTFRGPVQASGSNITFDGCTFNQGLQLTCTDEPLDKKPSITVQNCTIHGQTTLLKRRHWDVDSIYVFAHNLFDLQEAQDPVRTIFAGRCTKHVWVHLRAYNNIVIRRDPTDKTNRVIRSLPTPLLKNLHVNINTPFNYHLRRGDYLEEMFDILCVAAYDGILDPERGTADIPGMPGYPQPAMWDKDGYLRDWRNPTPGPIEALAPQRADRVTRRYVYGGGQLVQRETYRDRGASAPEITRTIQTAPGTSAPVAWLDSDGVIDVQMKDRHGLPFWTYRARAGRRPFDVSDQWEQECSGSGVLAPLPLPGGSRYMDYPAWHLRAIEGDYLMGRRGVFGWEGRTGDYQLLIGGPQSVPQQLELSWSERMLLNAYENPWQTAGYIAGGAAIAGAGLAAIVLSGGTAVPALVAWAVGGGLVMGGTVFAGVGAVTHDTGQAVMAGATAGVATAAAILTGGGAYALFAPLMGSFLASGMAWGAGAFASRTASGIMQREPIGQTLSEAKNEFMLWGTVGLVTGGLGPVLQFAGRGFRAGAQAVRPALAHVGRGMARATAGFAQRQGWRQIAAIARGAQHGVGSSSWNAFQQASTGVFRGVGTAGQATQAAARAYRTYGQIARPLRSAGQAARWAMAQAARAQFTGQQLYNRYPQYHWIGEGAIGYVQGRMEGPPVMVGSWPEVGGYLLGFTQDEWVPALKGYMR